MKDLIKKIFYKEVIGDEINKENYEDQCLYVEQSEYAFSVSNINQIINIAFSKNLELQDVTIKGIICNIKYHKKGHMYFSLKDYDSKIEAVMFNYNSNLNIKDGDTVIVHGKISIYKPKGRYQIYVDDIINML